jgi:hypothetical protein
VKASPAEVIRRLRDFCAAPDHVFWPDSVNLPDDTLFRPSAIRCHKLITDAYLPGRAVRNNGRLATFDRSVPLDAVPEANPAHLALIA